MSSYLRSLRRCGCLIVAALVTATSRLVAQAKPPQAAPSCVFSSFYKSSLAWESGRAAGSGPAAAAGPGDLVGRVLGARNGEGLVGAHVRVMPGMRLTLTDSTGRFAFRSLPQGRYHVTVFAPPGSSATSVNDSVTVGFDGLRMIAVLSAHTGDIVCVGIPRQPSNER
jgi:hypothetical protein